MLFQQFYSITTIKLDANDETAAFNVVYNINPIPLMDPQTVCFLLFLFRSLDLLVLVRASRQTLSRTCSAIPAG
jgi:hypothetical protein